MESRSCSMPEGLWGNVISEIAGKEERQFFCLCRVEETNPSKEYRVRSTNSATDHQAQEIKT
jgi:hypothetical protein